MSSDNRHTGVELFRIVLMFMIAMHHVVVHGLGLIDESVVAKTAQPLLSIEVIYNSFLVMGVNAFVLISGYWGIRFRYKGFLSLLLQGVIYSLVIGVVFRFFSIKCSLSIFQYWFLTAYLAMYLSAKYVNAAVDQLDDDGVIRLGLTVLLVQCGFGFVFGSDPVYGGGNSLVQVVSMYVMGRCLYRLRDRLAIIQKSTLWLALIVSYLLILVLEFLKIKTNHHSALRVFQYNNPLVILNSCILFLMFVRIEWKSRLVNSISPHMFGVYLLHDNVAVRDHVVKSVVPMWISNWEGLYRIPILAMVILVIGVVVDYPISELIRAFLKWGPVDSSEKKFEGMLKPWIQKILS